MDVLISGAVIVVSLPVMAVVAIAVRLGSKGPVFFRHKRAGKNGKEFQVLKFRTMIHLPNESRIGVTFQGDPRITPVGRFLRKWKLDELPQLFNVFKGEMSLVGPRPDLVKYLATLSPAQQCILRVRPGITSPATITFRREEELLAKVAAEKVEGFYLNTVLPKKIAIDLQYAAEASFTSDLRILLQTFAAIAF